MRVPLSWLPTFVPQLAATADPVAAALVRAGLELYHVHQYRVALPVLPVGHALQPAARTPHQPRSGRARLELLGLVEPPDRGCPQRPARA